MSQRRFAVMGDNIFKIALRLTKDQELCRLIKYTDRTPLSKDKQDVNGLDLLHKNILVVPKIPDETLTKENFVLVMFDDFYVDGANKDFKISSVQFTIICPYDEWLIEENSLRPYLIMERIDTLFNEQRLSGIGNLKFSSGTELVVSPQLGGYSLTYQVHEFN